MMRPLDGVRVLEVSSGVAGLVAGMLLADLGAEVVRPTAGPPPLAERAGWLCWSRGKVLPRVDWSSMDTAINLRRLADRADVVLTDAGAVELALSGLDATTVRSRSSRAVHVWMPPVSATGRFAGLGPEDILLDGLSGFASHHPAFEDRPVASVVPTRRVLQAAMGAVYATAGLVGRQRDGYARPSVVSGMHIHSMALATMMVEKVDGPALYTGGKSPSGAPHFRLYQGNDGRWFYLAALGINLFLEALNAIDRLDVLARDDVAGEFANVLDPDIGAAVVDELQRTFSTRPASEWIDLFRRHDVPAALVSAREDWLEGDVIAHACPPLRRHHPDVGDLLMPGTPVDLSMTPAAAGLVPSEADTIAISGVWTDVDPAPSGALTEAPPPLAGCRVLDLATYLAGPLVATIFAQLGADVTKVQAPAGDPYHTYGGAYAAVNHLKVDERLDLAHDGDRRALLARLDATDVLVHNLRLESLERLHLSDDVLAEANPDLVRCSVTAYGHTGPWVSLPGFDPIMQSLSGLAMAQGGDDRPVTTSCPLHDNTAGALGALGSLAALFARDRIGVGQAVSTSLAAASTLLQSAELTEFSGRAKLPVGGRDYAGPSATHRFYRASDRWIAVAADTDARRALLLDAVGSVKQVCESELARRLEDVFRRRTAEEWVAALGSVGVPIVPVTNRLELDNPYLVELDWSLTIEDPDLGRLRITRRFGEWPSVIDARADSIGWTDS